MNELDIVISIAKNEDGYLEKKSNSQLDDKTANAGSNNYTKYARDLDEINFFNGKKQGYAWCSVFVSWCFVKAFGVDRARELTCQPANSCAAGVGYAADYYKNKGQFHTSGPRAGDQIFFKNSSGARTHTGLVYQVDKNYVYTVEGNTSSAAGVIANGGCVRLKKYSLGYKYIYGYGRPNYRIDPQPEEISFTDGTYTYLKAKYCRSTPCVANNKIKYATLADTNKAKCTKDASGYARYRVGASTYLSAFTKDSEGNIWGAYKGKYSDVWSCVYDSTGYQVTKVGSAPEPTPSGPKFNIGDKVIVTGKIYVSSNATKAAGVLKNKKTTITRYSAGAKHPYNFTGDIGWADESSITKR